MDEESSRRNVFIIIGVVVVIVILLIIVLWFFLSSILFPPSVTVAPPTPTSVVIAPPVQVVNPPVVITTTPAPTIVTSQVVKIYLIALGDNGRAGAAVGCGDSVVPVERRVEVTTSPLRVALDNLLSLKEQFYGEPRLYNALYQSNLVVDSIDTDQTGTVTVRLSGTYSFGGTCDAPRFESQIMKTITQFSGSGAASVFINGIPLNVIVSQRGF